MHMLLLLQRAFFISLIALGSYSALASTTKKHLRQPEADLYLLKLKGDLRNLIKGLTPEKNRVCVFQQPDSKDFSSKPGICSDAKKNESSLFCLIENTSNKSNNLKNKTHYTISIHDNFDEHSSNHLSFTFSHYSVICDSPSGGAVSEGYTIDTAIKELSFLGFELTPTTTLPSSTASTL